MSAGSIAILILDGLSLREWQDCERLINSTPNRVFWHPWPDSKLHDGSGAGQGLDLLTRNAADLDIVHTVPISWRLVAGNGRARVVTQH